VTLTTRLSAFFLGALALVLAGFSATLYLLVQAHLEHQVEERLTAALEVLAATAEQEPDGLEWETHEHPVTLGRDRQPEQVRWTVEDDQGRLVDHSENLNPEERLPRPPETAEEPAAGWLVYRDGRPWQVRQRRITAERTVPASQPEAGKQRYRVLVLTAGVSLEPVRGTLRQLGVTLAGVSLGLWLLAAVCGRWFCRRALAPVRRMAATAHGMSAADLGQRLPDPGTGDELAQFAGAFNDLLDRVQEAFERQRRFTGDASHQLRTPLTAMLGQVEVALRQERSAAEYRQVLARVHGQAGQLRQIVEMLLFLARADAEARLSRLETIDLAAWLPGQVPPRCDEGRAVELRLETGPEATCLVRAQAPLLGQLLDNLLDNACKYSEPGTAVTVRLRRAADAVQVSVEDRGCGIAAEDLPHVFEPFYRSAAARRMGRPGTGLGLAVARRIAAVFDGRLDAHSEPGQGSRFTLTLPAWNDNVPDDRAAMEA
jgi:heavy metal sensor kinase